MQADMPPVADSHLLFEERVSSLFLWQSQEPRHHIRFRFPPAKHADVLSAVSGQAVALEATTHRAYAKEEVCSHGFRSTASTLLTESGLFNPDAIEAQLAHRSRGGAVRGAYLRGEFFEERVRMMEWWSDYLEKLAKLDSQRFN